MIGATIKLGAGVRSLTMEGHSWNLLDLDRHQISTIAAMVSETAGLKARRADKAPRGRPQRAHTIHN